MFPIIQLTILMWSSTDPIRYAYYTFTSFKWGLLGHLRYNMFWILYPFGVLCEYCCGWSGIFNVLSIEPESERPLTILMPNKLNVAIRVEYIIATIMIIYLVGFP